MKNIFQILATGCMALLMLNGCTNDAIDDLSGEYPTPEDVTLTKVASQSDVKKSDGSARFFNLKLTGDNGQTFNAEFCCANTWYLEGRTYTMSTASAATIGNFVSENTNYTSGSSSSTISEGNIIVTKTDSLVYTIYGIFVMSDKSVVRVHYNGSINYVEPQPEKLTTVLKATATAGTSFTTIEMLLGTNGLSLMSSPYGSYVLGSGSYVDMYLICATSALTAGTYTPIANGSEKIGTFTAGYQGSYMTWTWDAGTRYYTLTNNVASAATYLTTGTIKVAVSGTTYTVTIDSGSVYARYSGAITIQ
jgi:hypothetical protein